MNLCALNKITQVVCIEENYSQGVVCYHILIMSESSDEDCNITELKEHKQVHNTEQVCTELNFLPKKSREKYLKAYELFNDWRVTNGLNTFSDTVMLSYFMDISKTRQPNTLWSIYSMLKATIKTKCDVHIETFPKLMEFLKRKSEGHRSKKSKVFTAHNIEKFLNEAPDYVFLATKAALIIGISGACRTTELLNLTVDDIEKHSEKLLLVNLSNTKSKINKSFVIREEYVNVVEKYKALRPVNTKIDRFFLQYRNEKCSRQPIGVNKLGAMPRQIATFLKLQQPQEYTGHCFRRTSATLLDDSGPDLTTLKRKWRWKSSTVTEDSNENETSLHKILKKTSVPSIFPCTKIKPVDPLAQQLCSETSDQQIPGPSDVPTQIRYEMKFDLRDEQFAVKNEIEIPIPIELPKSHQHSASAKSMGTLENFEDIHGSIQRFSKDDNTRNVWTKCTGRQNWKPILSRNCSKHLEGRFSLNTPHKNYSDDDENEKVTKTCFKLKENEISAISSIKQEPVPRETDFEFITTGICSTTNQEPTSQEANEASAKNKSIGSNKSIHSDDDTKLTAREKELTMELHRMRLLAESRETEISALRSECCRLQTKNSELTTIIKKLKSKQND